MSNSEGKEKGFVVLWRKIADNRIWLDEPFTRGQAWVDLIMLANHKDGFLRVRGNRLEVKRGDVGWSKQRLSKRWQWSIGKVTRFLVELENDLQIVQKTVGKTEHRICSIITINNYETYQGWTDKRNTDGTQTEHRQVANNNGNNEKIMINNYRATPKNFYTHPPGEPLPQPIAEARTELLNGMSM